LQYIVVFQVDTAFGTLLVVHYSKNGKKRDEKTVKKSLFLITVMTASLAFSGCSDDNTIFVEPDNPPTTPQGVFSITGDGVVLVVFNGIFERDVKEYIITRLLDPINDFAEVGRVIADDNPNLDLIIYQFADTTVQNGITYYYAVAAEDFAGQVSELSAEDVIDTPRPEGEVILVSNETNNGNLAGFSLATELVVDDEDISADIYIDRFNSELFINAGNLNSFFGDIQDMGYTETFDEIGFAPDTGWSAVGFFELILGHTYVIRTAEGNYAKLRLKLMNLASGLVQFDFAYQTVINNRELAPSLIQDRDKGVPRPNKKEILGGLAAKE